MNCQYIIERLKKFDPNFDEIKVKRALNFAIKQRRYNNNQSLEIAKTITSIYPDTSSTITSLLFFSVAKNHLMSIKIQPDFNTEISTIFTALAKLFQIQSTYHHKTTQETFQLLLSLNPEIGIRVLLIRFAYLLHDIIFDSKISQIKYYLISKEISKIYVPLLQEIKVEKIKTTLQNVCFRILQPKLNEFIITFLQEQDLNQELLIRSTVNTLHDILSRTNIAYTTTGRVKSPYSIAKKLVHKSSAVKKLFDIIGIRIIVEKTAECYQILHSIYNNYAHIPQRYKDFIKSPKKNGYQSLHTIIVNKDLQKIEIQIRTKRMHDIAQFGAASHLQYKMQAIKSNILHTAYRILNRYISDILNPFTLHISQKALKIPNESVYLRSNVIWITKQDNKTSQPQYISSYQDHPLYTIVNSGEFGARSDGAKPICNRRAGSNNVTNFLSIDYKTSQLQNRCLVSMQTRYQYYNSITSLASGSNTVDHNQSYTEISLNKPLSICADLLLDNIYHDSDSPQDNKYSQKSTTLTALIKNSALILENTIEESNNIFDIDKFSEIKTATTSLQNTLRSNESRDLTPDTIYRKERNVASVSITTILHDPPSDNDNGESKYGDNEPTEYRDNSNGGSDTSHAQQIVSPQENFKNIIIIKFVYYDNNIRNVRIAELASILKGTRITHLDVGDNYIGDVEVKALTYILQDTNITHLNLGYNYLGETGVKALAYLKDTQIVYLDLGSNEIQDSGAASLASILQDTKITHLDLSCNNIGDTTDHGIEALASILQDTKITYLNLGCNFIWDIGIEKLAAILKYTNITYLNLKHNYIGDAGIKALTSILKKRKITINFEDQEIDSDMSCYYNSPFSKLQHVEQSLADTNWSQEINPARIESQNIDLGADQVDLESDTDYESARISIISDEPLNSGIGLRKDTQYIVNSGEFGAQSDGARAGSNELSNFSSIDYSDSGISDDVSPPKRLNTFIIRLGYSDNDIRSEEVEELIGKLNDNYTVITNAKIESTVPTYNVNTSIPHLKNFMKSLSYQDTNNDMQIFDCLDDIFNSGEFGAQSEWEKPICNRRAGSNELSNCSSIDYPVTKVDENVNEAFSLAIEKGDIGKVKELLMLRDSGNNYLVYINRVNNDGYTPLTLALGSNSMEIVLLLLTVKDINGRFVLNISKQEQKMLNVMFLSAVNEEYLDIAQKLLIATREYGLPILNIDSEDRDDTSIINTARELLHLLLSQLKKENYDLFASLITANEPTSLEELLMKSIRLSLQDIKLTAEIEGVIDRYELNNLDDNPSLKNYLSTQCWFAKLCYAIYTEDISTIEELIMERPGDCDRVYEYWSLIRNKYGLLFNVGQEITRVLYCDQGLTDYEIFSTAVSVQDYKTIEELIKEGRDINARSYEGYTVLWDVVNRKQIDIIKNLLTFTDNYGRYLVDINYQDREGISILLSAVMEGYTEIVELLVTLKDNQGKLLVNINHEDPVGNTALSFAAQEGHKEIIKILIALKDHNDRPLININHKDEYDMPVMHYFQNNDQIKQLLREHGIQELEQDRATQDNLINNPQSTHSKYVEMQIAAILSELQKEFNQQNTKQHIKHNIQEIQDYINLLQTDQVIRNKTIIFKGDTVTIGTRISGSPQTRNQKVSIAFALQNAEKMLNYLLENQDAKPNFNTTEVLSLTWLKINKKETENGQEVKSDLVKTLIQTAFEYSKYSEDTPVKFNPACISGAINAIIASGVLFNPIGTVIEAAHFEENQSTVTAYLQKILNDLYHNIEGGKQLIEEAQQEWETKDPQQFQAVQQLRGVCNQTLYSYFDTKESGNAISPTDADFQIWQTIFNNSIEYYQPTQSPKTTDLQTEDANLLMQSIRKMSSESESENEVDQEILLKKFYSNSATIIPEEVKEFDLLGESSS